MAVVAGRGAAAVEGTVRGLVADTGRGARRMVEAP